MSDTSEALRTRVDELWCLYADEDLLAPDVQAEVRQLLASPYVPADARRSLHALMLAARETDEE